MKNSSPAISQPKPDSTSTEKTSPGSVETRNIIDHYHYWKHEAILADLDTRRKNFTVVCCNVGNDFNIATTIRNANAFLAREVWVYGKKQYDRRGTVGTHNYTRFRHFPTFGSLRDAVTGSQDSQIVCIDNVPGSRPIDAMRWSRDTHYYLIFGQEQVGIPQEVLDLAHDCLYIRQYGSVRSLNVGTASGIVMYDYCSKVE